MNTKIYKVIYEVAGQKIILGSYKTKEGAEKRVKAEKAIDNFGKNGYREYIYLKMN